MLDDNPKLVGRSIGGYPVMGALSKADGIIQDFKTHGVFVDRIVIAQPDEATRARTRQTLALPCERHGVEVIDLSETLRLHDAPDEGHDHGRFALDDVPPRVAYFRVRHAFERGLAAIALVVLSPLLALTSALVWMDVGRPLLFWQERVGVRGRKILVHKFRTLKTPVLADGRILAENERLSSIGAFLRRKRLDELPQLFDIVRGHMSFIGPRPLLPVDVPEGAALRALVTPGLTGWAQVHGGNLVTNEEKNALDEWYVHHASPAVDLAIIVCTLRLVVFGEARQNGAIAEAMRFRERSTGQPVQHGASREVAPCSEGHASCDSPPGVAARKG